MRKCLQPQSPANLWQPISFLVLQQLRRQTRLKLARELQYMQQILYLRKTMTMEWTTPAFEEIQLNCEINCYANAEN